MLQLKFTCLCFVVVTFFGPSLGYKGKNGKGHYVESRLMLEFNWPETIKDLKRLPHIISCDHFYTARPDGTHDIKKCPDGQSFDFKTMQCKDSLRAKCWSKQFRADYIKKNQFVCPFPWGEYPNTNDCSSFYYCLNGVPSERKCPPSSLFDKVSRKCINEAKAMCADKTDVVEIGYQCPYKWGFFTHPKDCTKYYECLQKVPSVRTCNMDTLFDNLKRTCRHKSKVNCGARFNPYEVKYSTIDPTVKEGLSEAPASSKGISTLEKDVTKFTLYNNYSTIGSTENNEKSKMASKAIESSTFGLTENNEKSKIASKAIEPSTFGLTENNEKSKIASKKMEPSIFGLTENNEKSKIASKTIESSTFGLTENNEKSKIASKTIEPSTFKLTENKKFTANSNADYKNSMKSTANKEFSTVASETKENFETVRLPGNKEFIDKTSNSNTDYENSITSTANKEFSTITSEAKENFETIA